MIVESPAPGDVVSSPLRIAGRARGFWFFEASMPVTLTDATGRVLVRSFVQAEGEWMTEDYVAFETNLEFAAPSTERGMLTVEKNNPSGLPEHDASVTVPVRFR